MEELSASIDLLVGNLIGLTVVLILLSIGLGLSFQKVTILWRRPRKLAISLLSAVVLVPIVTYAVLVAANELFSIPEAVLVGLMLLAAASGSSALAARLSERAGADSGEAASLMVTLSISSIISAPIVVALTMPASFGLSGTDVAASVVKSILLPLFLGLAIRTWWIRLAKLISEPLTKLSGTLMNVIIVLILVKDFDLILDVGPIVLALMFVLCAIYMLIGHLLGGPEPPGRVLLGLFTSQRSGAIAMIVAAQAMPSAISAIVAFGVIALVVGMLYMGVVLKERVAPAESVSEAGS